MSVGKKIIQDRRRVSRIPAQLACAFTHEGATRPATITDLSLGGAFLTSKFLPPKGSAVTISIEARQQEKPFTLVGTVVHGLWGMSKQGEVSRFGVRFSGPTHGLIGLIQGLITKGENHTTSEGVPGK